MHTDEYGDPTPAQELDWAIHNDHADGLDTIDMLQGLTVEDVRAARETVAAQGERVGEQLTMVRQSEAWAKLPPVSQRDLIRRIEENDRTRQVLMGLCDEWLYRAEETRTS